MLGLMIEIKVLGPLKIVLKVGVIKGVSLIRIRIIRLKETR